MRQVTAVSTILVLLLVAVPCFAGGGSAIPDLVGTWTIKAEGGVLLKDTSQSAKTHRSGEFGTLNAEVAITKQQGRVFYGTLTSARAKENFIGVIGPDNKRVYYADEDGFADLKIVNKNKMEVIYRQVTASDAVVGVGTWTRKK